MTSRLHTQFELSTETAILYLSGVLQADDVARLCAECGGLPATIRTLRLDLRSLSADGVDAMDAVRALLPLWRESRGGHFRLAVDAPNLVATLTGGDGPRGPRSPWVPAQPSAAMTAAFL